MLYSAGADKTLQIHDINVSEFYGLFTLTDTDWDWQHFHVFLLSMLYCQLQMSIVSAEIGQREHFYITLFKSVSVSESMSISVNTPLGLMVYSHLNPISGPSPSPTVVWKLQHNIDRSPGLNPAQVLFE